MDVKLGQFSFTLSSCSTQFTGLIFLDAARVTTTDGLFILSHSKCQNSNLQFFETKSVVFSNVIFTNMTSHMNSSSSILVRGSSLVRIANTTFYKNSVNGLQSLIHVDSVESVDFSNSLIEDNFGGDSEAGNFISIINSDQVQMRNVIIRRNTNLLILIRGLPTPSGGRQNLTVHTMRISRSVNTTLRMENLNVWMSDVLIRHDTDENRAIVQLHQCEADFNVNFYYFEFTFCGYF